MNKDYHLVTTSVLETWKKDHNNLLLGSWCKRYPDKHIWKNYKYDICNYHWDDRSKLLEDDKYLKSLYNKFIILLSDKLNEIHGVNYDAKYWKILVGFWLLRYIKVTFDRWCSIEYAFAHYRIRSVSEIKLNENDFIGKNSYEAAMSFGNDYWNNYIFIEIIKKYFYKNIKFMTCYLNKSLNITSMDPDDPNDNSYKPSFLNSIVKKFFFIFTACFTRKNRIVFFGENISKLFRLLIEFKLGQIPALVDFKLDIQYKIDKKFNRSASINFPSTNNFEVFLSETIFKNIPRTYLENYSDLKNELAKMSLPEMPEILVSSTGIFYNDLFKLWAAEVVNKKCKLVLFQHGGNYGTAKFISNEFYEMDCCDYYLIWGKWKRDINNGAPVSYEKKIKEFKIKKNLRYSPKLKNKGPILIILMSIPRYSISLEAVQLGPQQDIYTKQLIQITKDLMQSNKEVVIRHHPNSYGRNDKRRWKESIPDLKIDVNKTIYRSIQNSYLNICTYNATTLLQLLSSNVPTLIFWDPEFNELRDNAKQYFKLLEDVGIYHKSKESLNSFIDLNYDNIAGWWNSNPTQNAVKEFNNYYCLKFMATPDDWVEILNEIK